MAIGKGTILDELSANYKSGDTLKAKLVMGTVAGAPRVLQQKVVDHLAAFEPRFSLPLLGIFLDFPLQDLAVPRPELAAVAAGMCMNDPDTLADLSEDAQIQVITSLGLSNTERALKPLRRLLVNAPPSPNVRFTIYEAFSQLPMGAGGYMLADGLSDPDALVRVAAARAAEAQLDARLVAGLNNLLSEPDPLPDHIVAATVGANAVRTVEALLSDKGFLKRLALFLKDSPEHDFLEQAGDVLARAGLDITAGSKLEAPDEALERPLIYAVDDSKTVLRMFQTVLASLRCTVKVFENPFEAIEWAQRSPPDILFTDLNMPEIDGIELTSTLRSSGPDQDYPIVMVTTQSQGEDVDRALNSGVDSFIQKPFSREDLVDAINALTDYRF